MDRGQSTGTNPNHKWTCSNQGFTTKQPERITLEPTEIANVPAETQGITNRPLINKPSIVTKDTRPATS
jgi:hypothetical protein